MPVGTVKWFNSTKGYGFIQPDNGGPDVFVHISVVERAGLRGLNEGQKVSFEEQRDPKRGQTSAENLTAVLTVSASRRGGHRAAGAPLRFRAERVSGDRSGEKMPWRSSRNKSNRDMNA